MRVISIVSQKGGVGKTTTTQALGSLLSHQGRRVLMIDMDPQASLSISCGVEIGEGSIADVMIGKLSLFQILWEVFPGLYLAPADIALAQVELLMVAKMGRENILDRALAALRDKMELDYCLIDCPPSLGLLTINSLVAADEALIPTRPEFLGRRALIPLMEIIHEVQANLNPNLKVMGILPTFWNPRLKHHAQVIEEWIGSGAPLLDIRIGQSIRAAESPATGKSITDYAPKNKITDGYRSLAEWIDGAEKQGS